MQLSRFYRAAASMLLCATMLVSSTSLAQQGSFDRGDNRPNQKLYRRLDNLERQVRQMQGQLDRLTTSVEQHSAPQPRMPGSTWTCTIRSFGTVSSATENSRGEALAKAIKKCAKGTHAIACDPRNAICDPN